jgi:hypothetical protein
MARDAINDLLAEGQALTLQIQQTCDKTAEGERMIADWCMRVEIVLRKYLKEAYVTRFHQGGSNIEGPNAMTVFKNNHRIETLMTFLLELRP